MAVQKFRVLGLTRQSEAEAERILREVPGVLYASANHEESCVEVDFEDDTVTTDEIRGVLAGLGFEARIAG